MIVSGLVTSVVAGSALGMAIANWFLIRGLLREIRDLKGQTEAHRSIILRLSHTVSAVGLRENNE